MVADYESDCPTGGVVEEYSEKTAETNKPTIDINIDFLALHSEVLDTESDSDLKHIYFKIINIFPRTTSINDFTLYLIDKYNTSEVPVKYLILSLVLLHVGIIYSRSPNTNQSYMQDLMLKIEENWNKYVGMLLEMNLDN